jgi:hypothetical protein
MNYCETELFGTVALPESIEEVLQLVRIHSGERRNVHLWRGQSNINWPIHSSAYRRLLRTHTVVTEKIMRSYEEYLLKHATHQGYRYDVGIELSDLELLARLQHHGAATRLIDCSRDILTALWFASAADDCALGLLFGIHSDHLGGGENKPENQPYRQIFENIEGFKHPQTWQPPVVSKRIGAQRAQFLYSEVSDDKMGSLAFAKEPDAYIAVGVTPGLKRRALEDLSGLFDIRYLTLFPDIDGFGHASSFRFDEFENERW